MSVQAYALEKLATPDAIFCDDGNPCTGPEAQGAAELFAHGPTTITGVAHIRHKETDRVGDLARELRKLGAKVDETEDGLTITPQPLRPAIIDTYNDHRMAMCFAIAGLKSPGIVINDPGCTRKTYPNFFQDLQRLSSGSA